MTKKPPNNNQTKTNCMGQIKFGLSHLDSATPAIIGRIRKGLNYFTGGIVIFIPFLADNLKTTVETLTTWIGIFMLSFNALAEMFGVPLDHSRVPSEDVTEVETHS